MASNGARPISSMVRPLFQSSKLLTEITIKRCYWITIFGATFLIFTQPHLKADANEHTSPVRNPQLTPLFLVTNKFSSSPAPKPASKVSSSYTSHAGQLKDNKPNGEKYAQQFAKLENVFRQRLGLSPLSDNVTSKSASSQLDTSPLMAYMLGLYKDHRRTWKNFRVYIGGRFQNLGTVTSVRTHKFHGSEQHSFPNHHILHFNISDYDQLQEREIAAEIRMFLNNTSLLNKYRQSLVFHLYDVNHIDDWETATEKELYNRPLQSMHHNLSYVHNKSVSFNISPSIKSLKRYRRSAENKTTENSLRFLLHVIHADPALSRSKRDLSESLFSLTPESALPLHLITFHRSPRAAENVASTAADKEITVSSATLSRRNRKRHRRRYVRHTRPSNSMRRTRSSNSMRRTRSFNAKSTKHKKQRTSGATKRRRKRNRRRHRKSSRNGYGVMSSHQQNNCKLRQLYVSFSAINWDAWIVAPTGLEAGMCAGKCPFPLSDAFTPTNHAIIQQLVHFYRPHSISAPCCVATRLEPVSLLMKNIKDQVILSQYEDMSVTKCGCR